MNSTKKNLVKFLSILTCLIAFIAFDSKAQTTGQLAVMASGGTYKVYYKPAATGTLYTGSIIGITAPAGTLVLAAPTNVNGTWSGAGPKTTQAGTDYWSFTLGSDLGITAVQVGTNVELFNFVATGNCGSGSLNINQSSNTVFNSYDYSTYLDNLSANAATGFFNQNQASCGAFSLQTPTAQSVIGGSSVSGNAATELAPLGGTSPYLYSQDTGVTCIAPNGTNALPTALTINSSSGAYSYTAPVSSGIYFFCVKVCDSSTPTPNCATKTYTVNVSSTCAANAGSLN